MNTKEAIKYLRILDEETGLKNTKEFKEIIDYLQRGEKYEAVFKIFVQFIFNWRYPISHKVMRDKVKELRQKYFPKSIKKTITIEFESKSEGLIDGTIRLIKNKSMEDWYNGLVKMKIEEVKNEIKMGQKRK